MVLFRSYLYKFINFNILFTYLVTLFSCLVERSLNADRTVDLQQDTPCPPPAVDIPSFLYVLSKLPLSTSQGAIAHLATVSPSIPLGVQVSISIKRRSRVSKSARGVDCVRSALTTLKPTLRVTDLWLISLQNISNAGIRHGPAVSI